MAGPEAPVHTAGPGRAFSAIGRSLRHRNYRLFFSGQTVSLIGTWLTRVATSWLVFRLSHSALVLGVVSFASLMPAFLLAPLAGVLVDRWNRTHQVLVVTQVLAALQSAVLAALTISGHVSVPLVLMLNALQGLVTAFDFPARQAFLVEMIEDRADLPNAIALNSSMVNLARLIGPSFAGVLIAAFGEGGCFAIDAVSYLAVIATLLMMRGLRRSTHAREPKRVWTELREGLAYARQSPVIVAVLGLLVLVSFTGVPYQTLLPMIVSEKGLGDARALGFLTAASGCGALAGTLFLASRRNGHGLGPLIAVAAVVFGAALMLFGVTHAMLLLLGLMFASGGGMMVQMAASNTVLQTVVDASKRGRVMALFGMAYAGLAPIGSLLGGFVADHLGASFTLEAGGLACLAGGLVFFVRALPGLRAADEAAHAAAR